MFFYPKCEEDRKEDRQTDLADSSDVDAVSKTFPYHDDKKAVGYKINRKTEKSLAKDEADMKKVSLKKICFLIKSLVIFSDSEQRRPI